MGTEYLVRPVGHTEDEEDASNFKPGEENGEDDFEPGNFKKSMMKTVQHMCISSTHTEEEKADSTKVGEDKHLGWQDLHYSLNLILAKLPFTDYIRCGAVCSWWRQAQRTSHLPPPRPNLPWVIYHRFASRKETHTIFNHYGMSRDIDLPKTRTKEFIGSGNGWLLYVCRRRRKYFLLNPVTNSHINLPHRLSEFSFPFVISVDPNTTHLKSFVVMFMIHNALVFCRPGDREWSTIETGEPYTCAGRLRCDMVACNGKIYVVTENGKFGCVDFSGRCSTVNWLINEDHGGSLGPRCNSRFLVESLGEILLVLAYSSSSADIYKADFERMTWTPVQDVGDRNLFLGRCCSLPASASETSKGGIFIGYPGDRQKWADKRKFLLPRVEEFVWTWKLAFPQSEWQWMQKGANEIRRPRIRASDQARNSYRSVT